LKVTNVIDSKNVAAAMRNRDNGVIRITRKFGRGYDLKLTTSAYVIVIANGDSIKASEVNQMLGRGCRAQGKHQGTVLIMCPAGSDATTAWSLLQTRKFFVSPFAIDQLVKLQ
jgi:hypothetical protein